ncbi:hypothetical protein [Clostridium tagluense]|uniref:Uncharacterized protein n=1 Tax=Clostridium tagluense TaxID=360422 RepID=A0A401ULL1_9CLOT|nr:hypothetical protein [Clostridium tagluense]GCD10417.1 hypothetical protein Ctaglu_20400 [Clostridium tagluense]
MHKSRKGTKIQNRIRKVRENTLFNLLHDLPLKCQSCRFNSNCTEMESEKHIADSCINYKNEIKLNDLIEMIKVQNINLQSFADEYGLKVEFLRQMLKGKILMPYKYYVAIGKRLHLSEFDEFHKYEKNFEV